MAVALALVSIMAVGVAASGGNTFALKRDANP